ncbi:Rhs element Vgr protein, partial [Chryseobacterium sp. LC2016-27]|nr:Rhs element Vgr protein [Chryseobacterium sp. LC2016-27]
PQNGEFEYNKEKQIVNVQWMDDVMEENIDTAFFGDKVSLLVLTRNYEEGETIDVDVEHEYNNEKKEVTYSGTVNKDGFAELKEKVEIDKPNKENSSEENI